MRPPSMWVSTACCLFNLGRNLVSLGRTGKAGVAAGHLALRLDRSDGCQSVCPYLETLREMDPHSPPVQGLHCLLVLIQFLQR